MAALKGTSLSSTANSLTTLAAGSPRWCTSTPRNCSEISRKDQNRVEQLRSLMVTFGDLTPDGRYVVGTSKPGQDDTEDVSDRAGFAELPGIRPGEIAEAIELDRLLASEYWKKTRFYQPADFLWQPTLFQPVGGMDQVQRAFRQQVATLGGVVHLNSPVTSIDYDHGHRPVPDLRYGSRGAISRRLLLQQPRDSVP